MRSAVLFFFVAATGLAVACTQDTTKAKDDKLCTPGAYVYCRCQDRQEGAKLCDETGSKFGKCEPCETDSNPEIPTDGTSSSSGSSSGFPEEDAAVDGSSGGPSGMCGNGIVENGEDCDDNDTDDNDGCNTSCKLSGTNPTPTLSCPGLEVHVWGGAHAPTLVGSTPGSGNRAASPTCTNQPANSTSGAAAADRIFKVVAHKTGTLNVAVTDANYDAFLYVATACDASNEQWLACRNGVNGAGNETLTAPVTAGQSYYVFVDGAGIGTDKEGAFRVTFSIP